MKFPLIIVFTATVFSDSCLSAVLPFPKYSTRSGETVLQLDEETAEGLIVATASSVSISLESSSNVLPTTTALSNESEAPDWDKFFDLDFKISSRTSKDPLLSKKHLHSPKYRIRHHPTYLIPIDSEPKTNSNSFEASSVTVLQTPATSLSPTSFQSVINLKTQESENFMQIISGLASSKEKVPSDKKATVLGKSIIIPTSEVQSEIVRKIGLPRQLTTIFAISSPAKSPILSCHKPDAVVSVKCLSNFARLTFLSDELSNAKISLMIKNETMNLSHNSVIYVRWWNDRPKSNGSLETSISNILTNDQLRSTCHSCRTLHANLFLHEGGQGCVLPVTCNSTESGKVKVDESYKTTSSNLIGLPVISTSLSFRSKEGEALQDNDDGVKSGQQVAIAITGISDAFPVGLFVRECHITIANGLTVPLLRNGCSISNLLDNFNLTSTKVNGIEAFSLNSRFTPYNSDITSQQLIFNCRVMVCEGRCGSQSACQPHLTNYSKNSKSRTIFEEILNKTIIIEPEGSDESGNRDAELLREYQMEYENADLVDSRPTPENFVTVKRFYSTIFILSCIYTLILVFCLLCMKHYVTRPKVYLNEMDNTSITTPERCLLNMDQISARRRSPTSTTIYD